MDHILILYSSTDGHTLKICDRLKQVIEEDGNTVTLAPIAGECVDDLSSFDKIVIGASIRYGKHNKLVFDFINRNLPLLESKANAFFSVNIVARKANKNRPETNPYVLRFLGRTPWKPGRIEVFAGKLDYPKYRFLDRFMIRLIMLMTRGPTDPATIVEYTDWQRVDDFGRALSKMQ